MYLSIALTIATIVIFIIVVSTAHFLIERNVSRKLDNKEPQKIEYSHTFIYWAFSALASVVFGALVFFGLTILNFILYPPSY